MDYVALGKNIRKRRLMAGLRQEDLAGICHYSTSHIAKAFFELPLMRREVLRLLFVCELTPEEISKRLHCSVSYVRLQKFYALKKLKKLLEE